MQERIALSIVIPVFNAERSLENLLERLDRVLSSDVNRRFEIILVDDSSRDDSWGSIRSLRSRFPQVLGIRLLKNSGQYQALLCGLLNATGEIVVTMDDDLQHPPEEIPILLNHLARNPECDVVIGRPEVAAKPVHRRLGSRLANWILNRLVSKPTGVVNTSFRAFRRPVANAILGYRGKSLLLGPMICSVTSKIENVTVRFDARRHGHSNYSLRALIALVLDLLYNYSLIPVRTMLLLGASLSSLTFCYAIYFVIGRLRGTIPESGFTTILLVSSISLGLIMFSLGVIGEYVVRTFQNSNHRRFHWERERTEGR